MLMVSKNEDAVMKSKNSDNFGNLKLTSSKFPEKNPDTNLSISETSHSCSSLSKDDSSITDSLFMEVYRRRGERMGRINRARPEIVSSSSSEERNSETTISTLDEDEDSNMDVSFSELLRRGQRLAEKNPLILPLLSEYIDSTDDSAPVLTESEASDLREPDPCTDLIHGHKSVEVRQHLAEALVVTHHLEDEGEPHETASQRSSSVFPESRSMSLTDGSRSVAPVTNSRATSTPTSTEGNHANSNAVLPPSSITKSCNSVPTGSKRVGKKKYRWSDDMDANRNVAGSAGIISTEVTVPQDPDRFHENVLAVLSMAPSIQSMVIPPCSLTMNFTLMPNRVNRIPATNIFPNVCVSESERKMADEALSRLNSARSFHPAGLFSEDSPAPEPLSQPNKRFVRPKTRRSHAGRQLSQIYGPVRRFARKTSTSVNSQSSCRSLTRHSQNADVETLPAEASTGTDGPDEEVTEFPPVDQPHLAFEVTTKSVINPAQQVSSSGSSEKSLISDNHGRIEIESVENIAEKATDAFGKMTADILDEFIHSFSGYTRRDIMPCSSRSSNASAASARSTREEYEVLFSLRDEEADKLDCQPNPRDGTSMHTIGRHSIGEVGVSPSFQLEPLPSTSKNRADKASSSKRTESGGKTRAKKNLAYYKQNKNLITTELIQTLAESQRFPMAGKEVQEVAGLVNHELEKMLDELQSKTLRNLGMFSFRELESALRARGLLYNLGRNELLLYFADFLNRSDFKKCLGVLIPKGTEHDTPI